MVYFSHLIILETVSHFCSPGSLFFRFLVFSIVGRLRFIFLFFRAGFRLVSGGVRVGLLLLADGRFLWRLGLGCRLEWIIWGSGFGRRRKDSFGLSFVNLRCTFISTIFRLRLFLFITSSYFSPLQDSTLIYRHNSSHSEFFATNI